MRDRLIAELAEILETDAAELSEETEFKQDRFDWDSLKGYAILLMIEEEFGRVISVDDFIGAKTVGDLMSLIGRQP